MPSEFTRDDVAALAALAHLDLEPSELDLFARQLGDILAYANELQGADTTGVPPTTAVVTRHTIDRDDVVQPCLDLEDVLANAPDAVRHPGLFRVPRVIG